MNCHAIFNFLFSICYLMGNSLVNYINGFPHMFMAVRIRDDLYDTYPKPAATIHWDGNPTLHLHHAQPDRIYREPLPENAFRWNSGTVLSHYLRLPRPVGTNLSLRNLHGHNTRPPQPLNSSKTCQHSNPYRGASSHEMGFCQPLPVNQSIYG